MESIQQQPEPDNPKKPKPKKHRRSRLEVHLKSCPKEYVPGSGPPLQPIGLLPPKDSTAYILERIILPSKGLAADGKPLPRRMTYIVSWTDLPAAQRLVPAMDILDWVSPRALEEWEFANTEDQLEQEMAQKKKTDNQPGEAPGEAPKPKRRGRPPKHSKIETAVVAVDEEAVPMKGAMIIKTPTKNRLKDFEGLSDEEANSARQSQWETVGDSVDTDEQGLYEQGMAVEDFESAFAETPMDTLRGSAVESRVSKKNHHTGKQFESFPSTGSSSRQSTPKITSIRPKHATKQTFRIPLKKGSSFNVNELLSGAQATDSISDWSPQGSVTCSNSGVETPDPESETATAQLMAEAVSLQKKIMKKPKSKTSTPKPAKPVSQETPIIEDVEPSKETDSKETDWEVKGIEGMEWYDVEGVGLVRYFKVRWEGDWPSDQNPSWEPESNLPGDLVRNYLKSRKRKRSDKPVKKPPAPKESHVAPSYTPKKKSMKQTTLSWGIPTRKFKSVSEAFAGGEEDELGMPIANEVPNEEDDDDELFIVEEPASKKSRVKASAGNGWGIDYA
ncbi:hypothetical protein F53441_2172 [Fusarium austroafricanum]|uniref:Chromo domain-containing protein n=1 Tax=Fusarium austroafricanum TaxID=2364996 RepID=A0A8H4KSR0_9HYPO|nr:hypothetical protein F53441_2172 [Fusarium austroafricanum]